MIHAQTSARRVMAKMKSGDVESNRGSDEMREIEVALDFTPNALASLVYRKGDTMVLACATKADSLPRSLRGAIDLEELGPIALTIDCDILNADGGTRCASITAASIAMRLAVRRLIASGECLPKDRRLTREQIRNGEEVDELTGEEKVAHESAVMPNDVAALSVGMVGGEVKTDLDYILDSNADVDMNVVMTSDGGFVEVQGTGEESTYTREELDSMVDAASVGIAELHGFQTSILSDTE